MIYIPKLWKLTSVLYEQGVGECTMLYKDDDDNNDDDDDSML